MDILYSLARPDNFLLLLLGLGAGLIFTRWRHLGSRLVVGVTVSLATIAVLPLGAWLLIPLENRFAPLRERPGQVDGIIMLGGGLHHDLTVARRQLTLQSPGERLVALLRLARRFPQARIVMAEGMGSLGSAQFEEILPARQFLSDMGIDPGRVRYEDQARNTHENAVLSKNIAGYAAGQRWILITSAWHMPRAVGAFGRAGWSVVPCPVDFRTDGQYAVKIRLDLKWGLETFCLAVREWAALAAYRILDRSDAWFPGPSADRRIVPEKWKGMRNEPGATEPQPKG